jgi:hypothetical protein
MYRTWLCYCYHSKLKLNWKNSFCECSEVFTTDYALLTVQNCFEHYQDGE